MNISIDPSGNDPEYVAEFSELFEQIAVPIRNHMRKEQSQGSVFRVLNVLAAHTAAMLVGCDDPEADRFFHACLNGTLQTAREDKEERERAVIANQHHSG